METLKITNDYSCLLTNDHKLLRELWKRLRWKKRGYFHTRLYKQKKWDGYVDFFSYKTGKFLTGLLPEVKTALNYWGTKFNIKDLRQTINCQYQNIDDQFLNQWLPASGIWPNGEKVEPIKLQDYQVDFINQAIKYKRGIVESPTSSGKTFVLVGIMKTLPLNTPTLVVGNRKSILTQNYDEIINWGFKNVGRLGSGYKEPNIITCATIQSLHHIEKLLPKFKAIIVDEIHLLMSPQCIKLYKKLKECSFRIALSATPFKYGETDLVHKFSVKGFFGPVFKTSATNSGKLTTELLQQRGRLAQSEGHFYYIDEPKGLEFEIYQDAVTKGIAQNWYFHKLVRDLVRNKLKGRTLIIVERLAHGDALSQLLPEALWIQGKDNEKTRKEVINKLKKSKDNIVAIATSGIFDVGVNVFIHNLVNAAGGKAEHSILQRMGRGLRSADDKEILKYFDFLFKTNEYLEDHSKERIKILKKENHKIILHKEIDF